MKRYWRIVFNKYLLAGVAFIIWTFFFDQNDWVTQRQRKNELLTVQNNIQYLQSSIAGMEKDYINLTTNDAALERFARESCRMKRDNEDLYVIENNGNLVTK